MFDILFYTMVQSVYTMSQKRHGIKLPFISLINIDRFFKIFTGILRGEYMTKIPPHLSHIFHSVCQQKNSVDCSVFSKDMANVFARLTLSVLFVFCLEQSREWLVSASWLKVCFFAMMRTIWSLSPSVRCSQPANC